ncbi:hypothetical protein NL676_002984 [Syzygium grande]|nr:hypothetical protein NL676_002984 [Syzygium grande]
MSSSSAQIIEHVVLFKVKDGTDPSRVDAMVDGINALISLDSVLHLAAGPVLHTRASSSPLAFDIMLHSRYRTKDDLAAYAHHPDHMRVVKELGSPICEDIMAVDWVTDRVPEGAVALPPGSAIRVSLFKLKEGSGDEAKGEVLSAVAEGIRDGLGRIMHATWGENFSPLALQGVFDRVAHSVQGYGGDGGCGCGGGGGRSTAGECWEVCGRHDLGGLRGAAATAGESMSLRRNVVRLYASCSAFSGPRG